MRKIPSAGTPIFFSEIVRPFLMKRNEEFVEALKKYFHINDVFITGSGTNAFYIILEALKYIYPHKKTVILPAYTAPSLILPCNKAGLTISLCDISLNDYSYDFKNLGRIVDNDVLCIAAVELFGIPSSVDEIKTFHIPILDDAAQAMGSSLRGEMAGTMGAAGVVSFHRGKNLSTYSGGAVLSCSAELTEIIKKKLHLLSRPSPQQEFLAFLKVMAVSYLLNPAVYPISEPFLRPFKSRSLHESFDCYEQTVFQEKLGGILLHRIEDIIRPRIENGNLLYRGLSKVKGIRLHKENKDAEIAFNQFPIIFEDTTKLEKIRKKLWKGGIETTRQYLKPLHHYFDLGYAKNEFPVAQNVARGLLLFPTHYGVRRDDIERGIEIIRNELEG
jgi:perosamine synthetase